MGNDKIWRAIPQHLSLRPPIDALDFSSFSPRLIVALFSSLYFNHLTNFLLSSNRSLYLSFFSSRLTGVFDEHCVTWG